MLVLSDHEACMFVGLPILQLLGDRPQKILTGKLECQLRDHCYLKSADQDCPSFYVMTDSNSCIESRNIVFSCQSVKKNLLRDRIQLLTGSFWSLDFRLPQIRCKLSI